MSVSFEFYKNDFHGIKISSETEFDAAEVKARAYVDRVTFERTKRMDELTHDVQMAICAVAEVYFDADSTSMIASENNDGYSVSYRDGRSSLRRMLRQSAETFLPSELLYRGL